MPEYTLRDPDGETHVVGNASDRARLTALGYADITEDTPSAVDAVEQPSAETKAAKTSDRAKASSGTGTETRNDSK